MIDSNENEVCCTIDLNRGWVLLKRSIKMHILKLKKKKMLSRVQKRFEATNDNLLLGNNCFYE